MSQPLSREDAWSLFCEWTESASLRKHVLAVEAAMRAYAPRFGGDVEEWGLVGMLHDLDYERHPDMDAEDGHPRTGMAELERQGFTPEFVRAVASHADFLGVSRDSDMEKALYAVDELSGFIMACAYVRPQGIHGMTPKSVKKKMKTPAFAAAIDRDALRAGAEELGVDFDEHLTTVIAALEAHSAELDLDGAEAALILYEHPSSGNCLKARVMLDQVGADYERVELDLFAGETRTPEHFARNPDGRIPVLELDDGTYLAESGAILLYLAEGTEYLPAEPVERAPRARVDVLRAEPGRGEHRRRALPGPERAGLGRAGGVRRPPAARARGARDARARPRRARLRARLDVHGRRSRALRLRPRRRRRRVPA